MSIALLLSLLEQKFFCVVEGGWIQPEMIADLEGTHRIFSIFCGYPHANAEERHDVMKKHARRGDWLIRRPKNEAINWIEQQIIESESYRERCEERGLSFVDFSDFPTGFKEIERLLEAFEPKSAT